MKKRIEWIDFLKGFLILTVMLGHTEGCPILLKVYVYSFHIPLFFFLSGYTMSIEKYTFKEFLFKKIKTLILPGIIFMILNFAFETLILGNNYFSMKSIVLGLILQMRGQNIGIAWFLVCLFICEILLYMIIKYIKKEKIKFSVVVVISILDYLYLRFIGTHLPSEVLPYSIDVIGVSMLFVYFGYFTKQKNIELKRERTLYMIIFFIISILTCFFNYYIFGYNVDIYSDKIGSYLLFVISAVSGIAAFIMLFKKIKRCEVLKYIGHNSLIYYVFHSTYFEMFNKIFEYFNLNRNTVIVSGIYIIATTILMIPLVYIINNYFPWVLGKFQNRVVPSKE